MINQVKMTVNELHEEAQKITDTDGPSVNDIARLKVCSMFKTRMVGFR